MPDKKEARSHLTERLATLMSQVGRIEAELDRPLDDDFAEQAVDREDDQALDTLESSTLAEIELTRNAIARLDAGGYGICTSCGDVIAAERLNALPAAAECISCASARHIARP
ncbi:TraR/DksA family transcriptional regulator [Flavisphingomonas formosensis]|uniref:TraR/DksA family transcriptional regulator n=1 Tax=Flavisphingomonas formosensis TaxID=861534 RepID=UPI0012F91645|nr:TraR/DksA C4-type zinc finger protein [Sphingomonas formosensis]